MANKKVTRRQFMRDGAIAAAGLAVGRSVAKAQDVRLGKTSAVEKTRSYKAKMEYRRLGKTGLWVSAVCLGGHWKRINHMIGYKPAKDTADLDAFYQNRHDVISRCIDVGINLVDACTHAEMEVYPKALRGRRDKMYLCCSFGEDEIRTPANRDAKKLLEILDAGLKKAKLEYVDIWRITALERGGRHTEAEVEQMIKALDTAKKQGKCRFTGVSSHDRKWLKMLIESYPDQIQVVLFPYTAGSKVLPRGSLFEAVKKHNVGVLGIKPFANNSLFEGDSSPASPYAEQDDRRARLAIRYILCNPAITAPIPGLVSIGQVDNVAAAVAERRELGLEEAAELEEAARRMWTCLGEEYHWLKEWEYV